jgi:hypothetical protein
MAKVYFCRFTDKRTKQVFYKFGHTSKQDVNERFDPKYDTRYSEFQIKAICSIKGTLGLKSFSMTRGNGIIFLVLLKSFISTKMSTSECVTLSTF